MNIAKTLYVVGDDVAAADIIRIALRKLDFLREVLELAAVIRWWGGDVQWTKQVLKSHRQKLRTVWEYGEWIEGWMALIHSTPPASVLDSVHRQVKKLDAREKQEWFEYVSLHFGPMGDQLFSTVVVDE